MVFGFAIEQKITNGTPSQISDVAGLMEFLNDFQNVRWQNHGCSKFGGRLAVGQGWVWKWRRELAPKIHSLCRREDC